jgi:hypothetical protein
MTVHWQTELRFGLLKMWRLKALGQKSLLFSAAGKASSTLAHQT